MMVNAIGTYYCPQCVIVTKHPYKHINRVHGGDHTVDVLPVVQVRDGVVFAEPESWGHYDPCVFQSVDDSPHEVCAKCGGHRVDEGDVLVEEVNY